MTREIKANGTKIEISTTDVVGEDLTEAMVTAATFIDISALMTGVNNDDVDHEEVDTTRISDAEYKRNGLTMIDSGSFTGDVFYDLLSDEGQAVKAAIGKCRIARVTYVDGTGKSSLCNVKKTGNNSENGQFVRTTVNLRLTGAPIEFEPV